MCTCARARRCVWQSFHAALYFQDGTGGIVLSPEVDLFCACACTASRSNLIGGCASRRLNACGARAVWVLADPGDGDSQDKLCIKSDDGDDVVMTFFQEEWEMGEDAGESPTASRSSELYMAAASMQHTRWPTTNARACRCAFGGRVHPWLLPAGPVVRRRGRRPVGRVLVPALAAVRRVVAAGRRLRREQEQRDCTRARARTCHAATPR